jgi:hypothetical protein
MADAADDVAHVAAPPCVPNNIVDRPLINLARSRWTITLAVIVAVALVLQ